MKRHPIFALIASLTALPCLGQAPETATATATPPTATPPTATSPTATTPSPPDQRPWPALGNASVVLFRHATAPGGGDPPGFVLRDCSTQRNLDDEGRAQARRMGAAFAQRGVAVGAVLASQWCRTRDTANLAFPGLAREAPAFNSFFSNRENGAQQTAAAQQLLKAWRGPGVLVVVTHQVNITALTGVVPASGEGVVLRFEGETLRVVGRIAP